MSDFTVYDEQSGLLDVRQAGTQPQVNEVIMV